MAQESADSHRRPFDKAEWQRNQRRRFKEENGYSTTSNYGAGGNRALILERDGHKCVRCGMTDAEHKSTWDRPITIDHKDRDRTNNSPLNLQTLCLKCHGEKDLVPALRAQRIPKHKAQILDMRAHGATYQQIADHFGFSIGGIFKWCKRWKENPDEQHC